MLAKSCSAVAYGTEVAERTFAATAAFTGAARLAFTRDMASRSVSSRPISASSSSLLMLLVVRWISSLILLLLCLASRPLQVGLVDVRVLRRVRICGGAVREDVRRHGRVDRNRDVRVHQ